MKLNHPQKSTLGTALLVYMVFMVFLITLFPFDFRIPAKIQIKILTNLADFMANIVLFIPIGFLFKLSRRPGKDALCLNPLFLGFLLSISIEFTQLFIPGRYTQLSDVFTNGLGAWLGAILFVLLKAQLGGERAGKLFSLELPLMNLVYLLIPLMWLNGLSIGKEAARLWLLLLLGLLGTGVLCSISIYRFRNTGALSFAKLSFFVMSWFIVATLPVLLKFPIPIAVFTIGLGIVARIIAGISKANKKDDRRLELPTLKRILPLFVLYLLLLVIWPTTLPISAWLFNTDFQELVFNKRVVFTFRFIEFIAAFTLLGYMIAEMRGRKNEFAGKTLGWIFFTALICSIIIETIRGYPPLLMSTMLEFVFIIAAGLYGGIIYRLQLAAIQRL
jgi:glycopeptide antibiotics resistance protein